MSLIITPQSKGIYRLTLAEIIYYLPDYNDILQTYLWQDYDYIPALPNLCRFIDFWERDLEGKIHSINISTQDELASTEFKFYVSFTKIH